MTATTLAPDRGPDHAARPRADQLSLADALDRILYRGVALQGNLTIGLADVDLLYLDLRLLLGSIDTIWPEGPPPVLPVRPRTAALPPPSPPASEVPSTTPFAAAPAPEPSRDRTSGVSPPPALRADLADAGEIPSNDGSSTAQGLIRLVLTLVKLLHDVLEKQAVHRMEAGRLTDEQVDRLGEALAMQADEIHKLQRQFGFTEKDLSLALDVPEGTY